MKGLIDLESSRTALQKIYDRGATSQLDLKGLRSAFSTFNELVQQFPESIYAKNARLHMISIRNNLAEHELQIANFYFDHKAYVAAINRASYVVQYIPEAVQVKSALKIMQRAYLALGEKERAEEIASMLRG